MTPRNLTTLALALTLAGCGRSCKPEGRYAGECVDGADNDGDGLYDCDDDDCAGSPDCTGDTEDTEDPDTHDSEPDTHAYTYEEFADDYLLALCDKLEECELLTDYFSYEDCLQTEPQVHDTGDPWRCADFDASVAQGCVRAILGMSCDEFLSSGTPPVCAHVCSNF